MEPNVYPNSIEPSNTLTALTWNAPEYEHYIRPSDWYWSLWIISIALSVTAIIFKNVLFGILILLIAFAASIFSHRKPRIIKFRIDQKGIYIEDTLYPYATLESFWIENIEGPGSKLIVKSKKKLLSYIILPIEDRTQDEARYILAGYLAEVEHREPLFLKLMEWFGF